MTAPQRLSEPARGRLFDPALDEALHADPVQSELTDARDRTVAGSPEPEQIAELGGTQLTISAAQRSSAGFSKRHRLEAAPHLGLLAALEATAELTARALRAAIPDIERGPFGSDPPELKTARRLVETCDLLLALVDNLRAETLARLNHNPDHDQLAWPF